MPKGVAAKKYRMTENRKAILVALAEDGGEIRSKEGRATGILHDLSEAEGSLVSFNTTLRDLENLGFIEREISGRRTHAIRITDEGRNSLDLEDTPARTAAVAAAESSPALTIVPTPTEEEWEDPDGIDYNILLAVFLKAAIRGMEAPSSVEVESLRQQNDELVTKISNLEDEVAQLKAEAASAIAERDQLQKNLNLMMSRAEQGRTGRGMDPIRKLLKPDERQALDALMRQIPTRTG